MITLELVIKVSNFITFIMVATLLIPPRRHFNFFYLKVILALKLCIFKNKPFIICVIHFQLLILLLHAFMLDVSVHYYWVQEMCL